jgi:hypothetical protein
MRQPSFSRRKTQVARISSSDSSEWPGTLKRTFSSCTTCPRFPSTYDAIRSIFRDPSEYCVLAQSSRGPIWSHPCSPLPPKTPKSVTSEAREKRALRGSERPRNNSVCAWLTLSEKASNSARAWASAGGEPNDTAGSAATQNTTKTILGPMCVRFISLVSLRSKTSVEHCVQLRSSIACAGFVSCNALFDGPCSLSQVDRLRYRGGDAGMVAKPLGHAISVSPDPRAPAKLDRHLADPALSRPVVVAPQRAARPSGSSTPMPTPLADCLGSRRPAGEMRAPRWRPRVPRVDDLAFAAYRLGPVGGLPARPASSSTGLASDSGLDRAQVAPIRVRRTLR